MTTRPLPSSLARPQFTQFQEAHALDLADLDNAIKEIAQKEESPLSSTSNSTTSSPEKATPPITPTKKNTSTTTTPSPNKTVQTMLKDLTPNRDLMPEEKKNLRRGLTHLSESPSPQRTNLARKLLTAFEADGLPRLGTLTYGESIIGVSDLEEASGWVIDFLQQLKHAARSPAIAYPILLNEDHVTTQSKSGNSLVGFHFCPSTNPLFKTIQNRIVNPFTEVWCGTWGDGKQSKISTFFPLRIETKEHLLWLISQASERLSLDNKAILQIPATKTPHNDWLPLQAPIHIEVYKRAEGTIYWSVFPIFYFAEYDQDAVFSLTPTFKIAAKEVLPHVASGIKADKKHIQYRANGLIYVDIAPHIPGCPVPKGILIGFPEQLF